MKFNAGGRVRFINAGGRVRFSGNEKTWGGKVGVITGYYDAYICFVRFENDDPHCPYTDDYGNPRDWRIAEDSLELCLPSLEEQLVVALAPLFQNAPGKSS